MLAARIRRRIGAAGGASSEGRVRDGQSVLLPLARIQRIHFVTKTLLET